MPNFEAMFPSPRYTLKAGEILVRTRRSGSQCVRGCEILRLQRASDEGRLKAQAKWFTDQLSVSLEQFAFAGSPTRRVSEGFH